ncbi:MAG: cobalt ECF transporter T component CbiQ [bacterium]|nr:cobalt ECF transporter T component CbiQ [bacterium]
MSFNQSEFFDLGYLDYLSYKDTFIHRLDPRAKFIVTLVFIFMVISFPKHEISGLIPFLIFPVILVALADIPIKIILKKLIVVSPFALMVGIFNPMLDRKILISLFGIGISGGWISYLSIIIKFILTISSALILIATTSFPGICMAMENLGMPNIFILQLMFIYRYIFILGEEVVRTNNARELRSFGKKGYEILTAGNILGSLLLRTIDRSERIYQAMCARGFNGKINLFKKSRFLLKDFLYIILLSGFFIFLRLFPLSQFIGKMFI